MTDWPVWLLALIDALAVWRLTRLVTEDVLTTRPRWAIIRWAYHRAEMTSGSLGDNDEDWDAVIDVDMVEHPADVPRLAVVVRCQACCSVWSAAFVVGTHSLAPGWWLPLAAVLALSAASSLLGSIA